MEKIAIISDIHGNLPALEAVLQDIEMRKITRIFCLGDLVGKGPSGREAVDIIRNRCEQVVQGNWDDLMQKEDVPFEIKWHQNQLTREQLTYLHELPYAIECFISGRFVRFFHASPFSVWTRIQPWDTIEKRLSMFENSPNTSDKYGTPQIVGYGDVHNAFIQHLNGKTLFNTGSVGNPLDVTQASYVIVEGVYNSTTSAPFSIQFVRIPYDIEKAIAQAKEARLPDVAEYEQELRTGRYRGIKK
ncbi:metallophosphoesterase family protein [Bacillus sp. FJAT-47783]|uniref:metallophosphoesterase family protein n=1 Tax=Bacillus sp. FJAT-47783 TaxID=2922712 RepID=UPI001FAE047F|nr:metallophosphoesterase family protein [Bacillus sp. FJAT-47783]